MQIIIVHHPSDSDTMNTRGTVHVHSAPTPAIHGQTIYNQSPASSFKWNTGLCGCCTDCSSCCLGCWCPCVLVGRSVEALDEGDTSCVLGGLIFCLIELFTGCGCVYTYIYRSRLRDKYGLPGTPCSDCCTDIFCLRCSICQVYREVKIRKMSNPSFENARTRDVPSAPDVQYMNR